MKSVKLILLITVLLGNLVTINAQDDKQLITIYDKDCHYCKDLQNITYQDTDVKTELKNYTHYQYEANSAAGKLFIEKYKISVYPTQIVIINNSETIFKEGYQNPKQQITFLQNPNQLVNLAKDGLTTTREITGDNDFLPPQIVSYLCTKVNLANSSTKNSYEEFMRVLKMITDKMGMKIENLTKFAFDNLDKLVCENKDTVKLRDFNTILKHALDTANYDFIRGAIFIKKDGMNICNPYIDFTHRSPMDVTDPTSEKESLIEFIDKLLADPGMGDFHDFGSIKDIKNDVKGCIDKQNAIKK